MLGLLTGFKITIFTAVLHDGTKSEKTAHIILESFNSSKTFFPK